MTYQQAKKLWDVCMQGEVVGADENGYIHKATLIYHMANLITYAPSHYAHYNSGNVIDFLKQWLAALEKGEDE